ncbi:MAG TPA: DMT family transporter [Steroidobacteraceae bacterium]|nr:DMT family transporter [Steroidobacteraceae bacterium]
MTRNKTIGLTVLAMFAFASNSLLCRLALKHTAVDPASFTAIRIVSGAIALWLLVRLRSRASAVTGHWLSACALFAYAIAFSWAYISLSAATGALLLFGAVQATMIGYGRWRGERLRPRQLLGFLAALFGLCSLLLPGLTAPPLAGAALMLGAGVAWGIYSLRGKTSGAALETTAGNFIRAVPLALLASAIALPWMSIDMQGVAYAIASGALASGIGYAIWYAALPSLTASAAATVQLSVPLITAFGGVILLSEALTVRLLLASIAILGGIALVVLDRAKSK